jgi:hypothetical protein
MASGLLEVLVVCLHISLVSDGLVVALLDAVVSLVLNFLQILVVIIGAIMAQSRVVCCLLWESSFWALFTMRGLWSSTGSNKERAGLGNLDLSSTSVANERGVMVTV